MVRYLARRVLIFVPSLMLVSILTFVMVRTAGGDPASLKLGLHASPESLARLRREMGLTDPWPVQYGHWFADAVRGDLGRSYLTGSRVTYEILNRFPATLELALASMLIAVPLGIAVGTVSAVRPRTLVDHLSMLGGLFGISIPTFWLGVMLIIVFAVWLGVVPVAGSNDVHMGVYPITGWDALRHLILPAATLAGWPMAILARHMRSSLLEVLHQDYARTARAKGLRFLRLVWRHAFPNALIPVVTVIALETGYLLGGAVITETVFAWPGIGNLTIQALAARDYMLVQGTVLLFAVVFAVLNIIADVTNALLDPRIRY
ncbi:MAG: ABC transporter permease [Bacillati bacterium ANGP1]|uniref:ABC transporter permease n=1 Tax=Candidatus Segetimicrobium genomatis TaxID=2569760 RepID=A0A537JIU9_9BACT|nr:MAG: ABC transporter permease [Terrabacteria group bacterium ANGP1]